VREYVEDETPYIASQIRSALIILEERGQISVEAFKQDGKKRKRGTYPDGTVINFQQDLPQ